MLVASGHQIGQHWKMKMHLYLRRSQLESGEGRIQIVPSLSVVRIEVSKEKEIGSFDTYLCILWASVPQSDSYLQVICPSQITSLK
jgi:hypothetical protein